MPNPYRQLLSLISSDPRQVGKVVGVSGSRVRVELVGGGVRACRGNTKLGSMVFVEGEQIIGEAPSLPIVMIEV